MNFIDLPCEMKSIIYKIEAERDEKYKDDYNKVLSEFQSGRAPSIPPGPSGTHDVVTRLTESTRNMLAAKGLGRAATSDPSPYAHISSISSRSSSSLSSSFFVRRLLCICFMLLAGFQELEAALGAWLVAGDVQEDGGLCSMLEESADGSYDDYCREFHQEDGSRSCH